jgi:hypothetical protein
MRCERSCWVAAMAQEVAKVRFGLSQFSEEVCSFQELGRTDVQIFRLCDLSRLLKQTTNPSHGDAVETWGARGLYGLDRCPGAYRIQGFASPKIRPERQELDHRVPRVVRLLSA